MINLAEIGPGLAVMLGDTEAGSVITAAQSGAEWGYRLLLLQILIMPILYIVQELAARLALGSGKGYVELIRQRFGKILAVSSVIVLFISCFGSLVTQMGGLASVGLIFGVPVWLTVSLLVALILAMVTTGAYHSVERIVIFCGLFELAFLVVAYKASPSTGEIAAQLWQIPFKNSDYLYLVAANLGTSIMPWAIFYQQSALLDKGLGISNLRHVRIETFLGAVLCQVITSSIIIASAASFTGSGHPLDSVQHIADAFSTTLGSSWGYLIFAIGLSGGALVATVLVCLTAAWSFGELVGKHHSLEQHPLEAPWFYAAFAAMLIAGAIAEISGINLIKVSIAMGVLNALLLPLALVFLYKLSRTELQGDLRLNGGYALLVASVFAITSALGLYSAIVGIAG